MIRLLTPLAVALSLIVALGQPRLGAQSLAIDEATAQSIADRLLPGLRSRAGIKLYPPLTVRFVARDALAAAIEAELRDALIAVRGDDGAACFGGPSAARAARTIAAALAPRFVVRYVGGTEGGLLVVPENGAVVSNRSTRAVRQHVESALAREMARLGRAESATSEEHPTLRSFIARLALREAIAVWVADRVVHHGTSPRVTKKAPTDDVERIIDAIVGQARANAIAHVRRLGMRDASAWTKLIALRPDSVDAFRGESIAAPPSHALATALGALETVAPAGEWTTEDTPQDAVAMVVEMRDALGERRAKLIAKGLVRGTRRTAAHPALGQAHLTLFEMSSASSGFAYVVAQRKVVADRDRRLAESGVLVERQAPRTIEHSAFPVLESTTTSIVAEDRTTTITRLSGVCRNFCFELVTTEPISPTTQRRFLDTLEQGVQTGIADHRLSLIPRLRVRDLFRLRPLGRA